MEQYTIVFDQPVNVRGSHAKYLCRKKNSELVFKIVLVTPHGPRKSVPKARQALRLIEKLDDNYTRRFNHEERKGLTSKEADEPKIHIVREKTQPVVGGMLKDKLAYYYFDPKVIESIGLICQQGLEAKIILGKEFYARLPDESKKALNAGYKNYLRKLQGKNERWIKNRKAGKYAFCVQAIAVQDKENEALKLEAEKSKKERGQQDNKENLHPNPALDQDYLDQEWQEQEIARKQYLRIKNAKILQDYLRKAVDTQEILKFLMKNREIDINFLDQETALTLATSVGNTEVAGKLLSIGANIYLTNAKGKNALCIASHNGYLAIVELLIKESQKNPQLHIGYLNPSPCPAGNSSP